MGNLTIRRLDDAVIDRLKERAQAKGRSLEAELRDLLTHTARQPLILDPLAEADRVAAMTPAGVPQTDSGLLACAGSEP
ncbi:hypothetical protein [Reyranella sp.]|uniref:FitA-like ribbon-helix-helix domain-containing protein n=1 Tax=Reyranella sp. TaxID=1929291 RepID=UPI0011F7EE82|nr:hypothetical protein [Reyranella sp.]TAJ82402.1 MAG: hypothetical protein EPO50_26685 [Reyranella sp.]